jgi:hypothetical protein
LDIGRRQAIRAVIWLGTGLTGVLTGREFILARAMPIGQQANRSPKQQG